MFVVRSLVLLLQILRRAQKDREREFRKTFLVTIDEDCYNVILNGAAGEVKDLEYHIGPPHWQPSVIPKEICTPKMPLKAYIDG